MNKHWYQKTEQIRQATGLPISCLTGSEEAVSKQWLELESSGWETVVIAGTAEEMCRIAILGEAWPEASRALLSLFFDAPVRSNNQPLEARLTEWLSKVAAGQPAPPPEGLDMQWPWQEPRQPFLLERSHEDAASLWSSLLPILRDFFQGVSPSHFILQPSCLLLAVPVSSLGKALDPEARMEWAFSLHDLISTECMENVRVIAGEPIDQPALMGLAVSKCVALLEALRKYRPKTMVACTEDYPLERWITQLPPETVATLRRSLEAMMPLPALNAEQAETLEAFFSQHLNSSETARQLFLHRSTLIYRLDKLTEQTGLDPRRFSEAVLLQLLLLFRQK